VSHSGPVAKGSWAWTLPLTDVATGWTECAPLLVREQTLLVAVLSEVRKVMPFPLLGFDSDNDSVFINETLRDYCAATGVTSFTPRSARRINLRRKAVQKGSASEEPMSMPSTSRRPSLLTPTAMITATETIRPF
jgi:hypothetical protein